MSVSKHLSSGQLKGLRKSGDVLIPGDDEFPSFSQSGSMQHVDRMLDYMNASDLAGVKFLFGFFRFLPAPLVRLIMHISEQHRRLPGPLAAACRMVNIGVKGVAMTLYYSDLSDAGPSIHQLIKYDAKIVEREPAEAQKVAEAR